MAFEAFFEALGITFTLPVLGGILLGLLLGLVFGAVPGLNAVLGIVLLLPFVWTLSPFVAFAIMLSLVSAVHTSNTFPAFFFNVPGSPSAAATILDGYPMARNGDAARGLTAAFVVSAVGGVIGALVLLFALPALQPVVLAFAAPERFMLVVLGILMISFLSGAKPVKGLLAGVRWVFGWVPSARTRNWAWPASPSNWTTCSTDFRPCPLSWVCSRCPRSCPWPYAGALRNAPTWTWVRASGPGSGPASPTDGSWCGARS